MSSPSTQIRNKDFPATVTGNADLTVTNASNEEAVLPLGTVVPPNSASTIITWYEWQQVPTGTRTAFGLTAV